MMTPANWARRCSAIRRRCSVDDAIFVQGGVGGYMQTLNELVELSR